MGGALGKKRAKEQGLVWRGHRMKLSCRDNGQASRPRARGGARGPRTEVGHERGHGNVWAPRRASGGRRFPGHKDGIWRHIDPGARDHWDRG